MDTNKFNEVMDFAIKSEQEAADFYKELQEMSSFEGQKDILKDFELMELGHKKILQNIKTKAHVNDH